MTKLFCSDSKITSVVKFAANAAGVLIAFNNPIKAAVVLPVAKELLTKSEDGSDMVGVNALIKQGIIKLIQMFSDDAKIQVEAAIILSSLEINVADNAIPQLTSKEANALILSFVSGLEMGVASNPVVSTKDK